MAKVGTLSGSCHCGNISVRFETAQAAERLTLRSCTCGFCSRHGARTTTDPKGKLTVTVDREEDLRRYRFATGSSEFLICRGCGVYVAAVLTVEGLSLATLNVNVLDCRAQLTQLAEPVSYDGESVEMRIARRKQRWTPACVVVKGVMGG